jgi:hypothetical protein
MGLLGRHPDVCGGELPVPAGTHNVPIHTCKHTCMHTCMHTYMHTYGLTPPVQELPVPAGANKRSLLTNLTNSLYGLTRRGTARTCRRKWATPKGQTSPTRSFMTHACRCVLSMSRKHVSCHLSARSTYVWSVCIYISPPPLPTASLYHHAHYQCSLPGASCRGHNCRSARAVLRRSQLRWCLGHGREVRRDEIQLTQIPHRRPPHGSWACRWTVNRDVGSHNTP